MKKHKIVGVKDYYQLQNTTKVIDLGTKIKKCLELSCAKRHKRLNLKFERCKNNQFLSHLDSTPMISICL